MKGEYISIETSKIMADIEKENKELHDRIEKLIETNKLLWEENTRLSNGRELEQNAIDTLRERIDKEIENIKKINNKKIIDLNWELEELLCILKGDK